MLNTDQRLDVLKAEYVKLSDEVRMFVQQQSSSFTIFGSVVGAALIFCLQGEGEYKVIFPIIPYFIFVIASVSISQAYTLACEAERIRQIEIEINNLNGGIPVMMWESIMARKLIYPPFLKVPKKDKRGFYYALNPVYGAFCVTTITVIPVVVFCIYKAKDVIVGSTWYLVYLIITSMLSIIILLMSGTFFRMERIMSNLNFESQVGSLLTVSNDEGVNSTTHRTESVDLNSLS